MLKKDPPKRHPHAICLCEGFPPGGRLLALLVIRDLTSSWVTYLAIQAPYDPEDLLDVAKRACRQVSQLEPIVWKEQELPIAIQKVVKHIRNGEYRPNEYYWEGDVEPEWQDPIW